MSRGILAASLLLVALAAACEKGGSAARKSATPDSTTAAVTQRALAFPGGHLDLVARMTDANGFLIDPHWERQDSMAGVPAVDQLCQNFAHIRPDDPKFLNGCTTQKPAIEPVFAPPLPKKFCVRNVPSHVNWRVGRPQQANPAAVVSGRLLLMDRNFDGDIDIMLRTPGDPGRTAADPVVLDGTPETGKHLIELEFLLREVRDLFRTDYWTTFTNNLDPQAGGIRNRDAAKRQMDGFLAVATGVYGVDGVHGSHSEIHPVFSLAVRTGAGRTTEHWEVFARNWGTEGFCSQNVLVMTLPAHTLRLWLPWRAGADSVHATVDFPDGGERKFSFRPSTIDIPFELRAPEARRLVDATIDLKWFGHLAPDQPRVTFKAHDPEPSAEDSAADAWEKLPRAQERAILRRSNAFQDSLFKARHLHPHRNPPPTPAEEEAIDSVRAAADSVRVAEWCRLKNGAVPGLHCGAAP